jgi:hypothetical protein
MAGADGNIGGLLRIENSIFVFDCEFRNKQILDRIEKLINKGVKVCIWPKHMANKGKDINDFIKSGMTSGEIETVIKENTYKGLMAKTILAERKRV